MRSSMIYRAVSFLVLFSFLGDDIASATCTDTVVPTPVTWPAGHFFTSAAAISPQDVWIVGRVSYGTVAEHWNGSQWAVYPTPSPNIDQGVVSTLNGVSAASSDDVWAVGVTGQSALIEHWNGSDWTVVPSPSIGTSSQLVSISATASSNV